MNINVISLVIICIIAFTCGYFIRQAFPTLFNEHLINLDDSRKIELSKCCTDDKCYNKPPHLRDNCQLNKDKAVKDLDSQFKQMYTQEEYYKLLDELNILKEKSNNTKDIEYTKKMNEKLSPVQNVDEKTFNLIIKDDRDEVRGSDQTNYASYKPTNK
jgi:hypothetical protein